MIRPTFLGFETAKKGLTVAQKGIDIAGQNMVNWDSEGYTRQRIEQVALSQDRFSSRFVDNKVGIAGQGVDIVGISQQRDSFLDKRYRAEYGDTGYFEKSGDILGDIENALDILNAEGDEGLRGRLMALRDALDTFAGSPDSPTHANIVATAVKGVAQTLQMLDEKLNKVASQHTYDMEVAVDDYNDMLAKVAHLNKVIMEDSGVIGNDARYGPNELYDERNVLLDNLSKMTNLEVTHNNDGTVTLAVGNQVVVQGTKHETLDMAVDDATGLVSMRWLSTGKNAVELGKGIETGSLKAAYDYINGRGTGKVLPGETTAQGVRFYKDQLNSIASQFADVMNNTIPNSFDGSVPGYKKLVGTTEDFEKNPDGTPKYPDPVMVTAENISISEDWSSTPDYIMTDKGILDTTYILRLKDRLDSEQYTFGMNGVESYNGSFLDFFKQIGTTLGTDINYQDGRYDASVAMSNSLNDRRDSVAGVNIDEETSNLLLYNKSLSAASRLMTTLDEALDVLINRTGKVGL